MISNKGRVKSLRGRSEFLSKKVDKDGYEEVGLFKNKSRKYMRVHRIVATHFIENKNNLPQINHIDENKRNNSVENLEWCTPKYNNNYGARKEKYKKMIRDEKGRYCVCAV